MIKSPVLLATAVCSLALAGAVGVGVATADPTTDPTPGVSSPPTAGPTTASGPNQGAVVRDRGLVRRALHGEVTLAGEKHRVVDFQRGTVTAVSNQSLTVRSADGFVGTYVVGSKTRIRVAEKPAVIGEVATGDRVRVVGVTQGQTSTALRTLDRQQ